MSNHSIIAPSASARRHQCPASSMHEAQYKDVQTDSSREGVAAHELAAMMLNYYRERRPRPARSEIIGATATNGVVWDDDSYDGAEMYANDVISHAADRDNIIVELKMRIPQIHDQSFGTPDCWLYNRNEKSLRIWDYKFGHIVREAEGNHQLIEYIAGILPTLHDVQRIIATIVQPRARHIDGPIRSWHISVADMQQHIARASAAAHAALSDAPPHVPGRECLYCKHALNCAALHDAAVDAIEYAHSGEYLHMSARSAGYELIRLRKAMELIKARVTAVEAYIEAKIISGESVPGWQLQSGSGRLKWNMTDEQIIAIFDILSLDVRAPPKAITPTQARKLGAEPSLLDSYTERKNGSAELIRDDRCKAIRAFNANKTR